MTRYQALSTDAAPKPIGPFSQAISAGELVYASGQIGVELQTGALPDGTAAQTERALDHLAAVLVSAGLGFHNVVKVSVFLVDLRDFAAMNEVYARRFSAPYPARTTVQVAALPGGARVEIDLVARRPVP